MIFTHAMPVRVLAAHSLGKQPQDISSVPWAGNASVTKLEYADGALRLIEYGDDSFMGELSTRLPENV